MAYWDSPNITDTPFPMKTKTLMVQSGSSMARLGDFRRTLRIALDKLVEMKELRSWSIDPNTDLVTVTKFSKKRLSKQHRRSYLTPGFTGMNSRCYRI